MASKKHPAKYSDALLPIFEKELEGYDRVLDPFAGTGKIREVRPDAELLEIEPEWAEIRGATVGDALDMPWPDGSFDAVCTSPTYANRMADHHNARDASKRNTYRHTLGRELHPNNSGKLQWGHKYRLFHFIAWKEVKRVLRPDGKFILNISDHIRKGKVVPVAHFHKMLLILIGFDLVKEYRIETPRQRQGENGKLRVDHEMIYVFRKEKELKSFSFLTQEFERAWPDMKDIPEGRDMFAHYPVSGVPQ